MILMLTPFVVLCWMNCKANIKKPQRYKQFLMPLAALVLCTVAIILLTKIYDWTIQLFLKSDDWVEQLSKWLVTKWPNMTALSNLLVKLAKKIKELVESLNLEFWAFYVANALILFAYVTVKKPIVLFMKGLFRDGNLFQGAEETAAAGRRGRRSRACLQLLYHARCAAQAVPR